MQSSADVFLFNQVVETSGAALVQGGVSGLKEMLKKLEAGGVLFVDESYQLKPKTNALGAQVRAELLRRRAVRRRVLIECADENKTFFPLPCSGQLLLLRILADH